MTAKDDEIPPAILAMLRYLLDRTFELTIRAEALRSLLVKRGVFSNEQFDAAVLESGELHEEVRQQVFAQAASDSEAKKVRQLLETFEAKQKH
jgi:hypothetical protein